MHTTKIDWADCTCNPITGCLNTCEYCYARKQSVRFAGDTRLNRMNDQCQPLGEDLFVLEKPFITRNNRSIAYPFGFAPTLHKYRLHDFEKRKVGVNIFICSMADMFGDWVPDEWIEMIFNACIEHKQHNYMFLTKNPARYLELAKQIKLPKGDNMWYGTTVTTPDDEYFYADGYKTFLSIEPIFSDFGTDKPAANVDWIIVGAETGRRKNKVVADKQWIRNLKKVCNDNAIPIFMKESLIAMEEDFVQEFPEELCRPKPMSEKKAQKLMDSCMECGGISKKADMQTITIRKGRNGANKTIGFICDNCFCVLAEKWGVDIENNK